jgi:hypothetical protein
LADDDPEGFGILSRCVLRNEELHAQGLRGGFDTLAHGVLPFTLLSKKRNARYVGQRFLQNLKPFRVDLWVDEESKPGDSGPEELLCFS